MILSRYFLSYRASPEGMVPVQRPSQCAVSEARCVSGRSCRNSRPFSLAVPSHEDVGRIYGRFCLELPTPIRVHRHLLIAQKLISSGIGAAAGSSHPIDNYPLKRPPQHPLRMRKRKNLFGVIARKRPIRYEAGSSRVWSPAKTPLARDPAQTRIWILVTKR